MRKIAVVVSLVACTASLPALAADFGIPPRKAGEWKIEMLPAAGKAAPATTFQLCLDAETDKALMQAGSGMVDGKCTVAGAKQEADGVSFDGSCDIGGMKTTSHTVISGDFQSSYTMKVTSKVDGGPPGMPKESVMTQIATYVGACPADMAPGDMLMPGGMKVNALKAIKPAG
jgi:hypothetical protein